MWTQDRGYAAIAAIWLWFVVCCVLGALALIAAVVGLVALLIGHAFGMDDGTRFQNVDPGTRAWFKSVQSPRGIPCCDLADGHRTAWKADAEGNYWALVDNEWLKVPQEAVILNAHNPTGESIVWYMKYADGTVYIRCFVPADGA